MIFVLFFSSKKVKSEGTEATSDARIREILLLIFRSSWSILDVAGRNLTANRVVVPLDRREELALDSGV